MEHVTTALIPINTVAAKTMYVPKAMCGIKSRMSITKAIRETRKVMTVNMNWIRRYLAEWLGAWK